MSVYMGAFEEIEVKEERERERERDSELLEIPMGYQPILS